MYNFKQVMEAVLSEVTKNGLGDGFATVDIYQPGNIGGVVMVWRNSFEQLIINSSPSIDYDIEHEGSRHPELKVSSWEEHEDCQAAMTELLKGVDSEALLDAVKYNIL